MDKRDAIHKTEDAQRIVLLSQHNWVTATGDMYKKSC